MSSRKTTSFIGNNRIKECVSSCCNVLVCTTVSNQRGRTFLAKECGELVVGILERSVDTVSSSALEFTCLSIKATSRPRTTKIGGLDWNVSGYSHGDKQKSQGKKKHGLDLEHDESAKRIWSVQRKLCRRRRS